MNATVRRFVFTLNNYSEEDVTKIKLFINTYCKYGIFGKELAPTTNTPHLQGFCNLEKPMRFNTVKKHFNNAVHIEKAMGTDEQNQKYCSKSGDIFEKGTPVRQGQRSDLESMVAAIKDGETDEKTLAELNPSCYIRYFRGIREFIRTIHPIAPRDFKTEVFYYWGPPGTGKSRRALEEANTHDSLSVYYKPRGLWWDGYKQQKCVIIDDFYGWIKYDELLKICDRYPYKVQVKGGFEEFKAEKIWITSNVDIDELYKFIGYKPDALLRRITNKVYIA
ncbi:replication-associated protein [Arboreal ant associated circular virus 1]|uniref:Replication-associated protein n=1 Tax=Arboreal ant associated circular virus 1 TaxID=2293273 RepID=A0A346BP86_9CIRC|nr:replication-associated protein [Arboreal ant associated circular virus 1]AXL65883.1 replication-associated protein [Arboreal ant associated circular virus 1]AXL65885.1 replication-associated protein [Arboreal ant associated circular virus 1]